MRRRSEVIGLDIEVDTTGDALDPRVAPVRAVALSTRTEDLLLRGAEPDLLVALDEWLASVPRAVLATWNGAGFDLPFLADRAAGHGIELGLRLKLDPAIRVQRPLAGHRGAYRAAWYHHRHLDTYLLYPARQRDLSAEARHACAPSDARLARVLTERRWPAARRLVDPLPESLPDLAAAMPPLLTARSFKPQHVPDLERFRHAAG